MTARNAASERQLQAAEPRASTWLAANAGSGKTRVLTDRVARLLLDGANPQRILCLTYTKAAASEMQNRLFRRLGSWAMLPDDRLAADLADLTDRTDPDPARLAEARRLFARAIETPGGLKIQTIHSFCATLLRRFPLEARVSPTFTEIEDRAADLMRAEIIEDMAAGPQASLVDGVARHVTDQGFEALSKAITANRAGFAVPRSHDDIAGILGLPPGYDTRALLAEVFVGGEVDLLSRVRQALASGGRNDAAAAGKLSNIVQADLSALAILEDVLLTGATAKAPFAAKIGNFPTKGMREGALAADMPALEALMARVEAARPRRLALAAADKAAALHAFARAFLDEYARRKEKRGRLDFDDLIERARLLLTDPAVAAWVLWRLDGGIDHILVDEAQDTSPAQWDVIARLAQEFSAGVGARAGVDRTLFVVGDKKQSIYSFQGADPGAFDRMRDLFRARLAPPGPGLMSLALEHSFRSSPAILSLVDQVFAQDTAAGFDERHIAFKDALPGRVDLWPVVPAAETTEDPPWTDPVDRPGARHHTVILAERIADTLNDMLQGETTIPIDGSKPGEVRRRRLRPGDILILVQRRSDLFAEIIRACKASRLPVAGADRLKVGAELAVRDLAALLRVLATPEDDLSLAATLRSPLFGWSEQDLFDLAHRRDKVYLWRALQGRGAAFPETVAMLEDLRDAADFLRPYDLIERILTRHRGRQRLIARLGAEAEDGIDALLAQALAYERSEVPSLTGFLIWMETDDLEIKRQMGAAGNRIRVMTVHGAKGLEAPVVILPDTGTRRAPRDPPILQVAEVPCWSVPSADMPPAMADARSQSLARAAAERLRLLYVAMTRAETWLIVAAAGNLPASGDTWYQRVEAGMQAAGATEQALPGGPGLRLEHADWDGPRLDARGAHVAEPRPMPDMLKHPPPSALPAPAVLSPSDLGGAKALPGEGGLDEEAALARGRHVHLLLEHLPRAPSAMWPSLADRLLADVAEMDRNSAFDEAHRVLTTPALAPVFAGSTLAEVAVTAPLGPLRLHGIVDRLILSPDHVCAVDFKTNALVPADPDAVPDGLLRQMGAYAKALTQVYPDRRIETALLWTRTATLMPLPNDLVERALAGAPQLDAESTGS